MAKYKMKNWIQCLQVWFIISSANHILAENANTEDHEPENIIEDDGMVTVNWKNLTETLVNTIYDQTLVNSGTAKDIAAEISFRDAQHHLRFMPQEDGRVVCRNKYNDIGICMPQTECSETKGITIGNCIMSNKFGRGSEQGVCCLSLGCTVPEISISSNEIDIRRKQRNEGVIRLFDLGTRNTRDVRALLGPNFQIERNLLLPVTARMHQCGISGKDHFNDVRTSNPPKITRRVHIIHADTNLRALNQPVPNISTGILRQSKFQQNNNLRSNKNNIHAKARFVEQSRFSEDTNIPQNPTMSFRRIPFRTNPPLLARKTPSIPVAQKRPMLSENRRFNQPRSNMISIQHNPIRNSFPQPFVNMHHGFAPGHTAFHQHEMLPNGPHFKNRVHMGPQHQQENVFKFEAQFPTNRQRRSTDDILNVEDYSAMINKQIDIQQIKVEISMDDNINLLDEHSRESQIFSKEEETVKTIDEASHSPWMLALWIRTPSGHNIPTCGAALISRQYALTAAHCVNGNNEFTFFLRGGSNINLLPPPKSTQIERSNGTFALFSNGDETTKLDKLLHSGVGDDEVGGIRIDIDNIMTHPKFNPFSFENDIALIKFKDPIVTKRDLFPICLPPPVIDDQITDYSGESATVAGWGCLSEKCGISTVPTVLQEVEIPIITNELAMCWFYNDSLKMGREEYIPEQLFIVGGDESASTATCKGDSGSPVIRVKPNNMNLNLLPSSSHFFPRTKWEVIGLVSWSKGCGRPFRPSVWTRVEQHVDWIRTNMNGEDDF